MEYFMKIYKKNIENTTLKNGEKRNCVYTDALCHPYYQQVVGVGWGKNVM